MDFEAGSLVWLEDDEEFVLPAKVVNGFDKGEAGRLVKAPEHGGDGSEVSVDGEQSKKLVSVDEQVLDETVTDLIQMNQLSEHSVMHKLRLRFKNDDIYTAVSAILVSANPFKRIDGLFNNETLQQYLTSRDPSTLDPHIFLVAKQVCAFVFSSSSACA